MTTHWVYLTRDDVAAIHDRITSAPIRDENLLLSAVDKPWASYMGVEVYPNLEDKAAALLIGLSRNHPFVAAWMRAFAKPLKYQA